MISVLFWICIWCLIFLAIPPILFGIPWFIFYCVSVVLAGYWAWVFSFFESGAKAFEGWWLDPQKIPTNTKTLVVVQIGDVK